MTSREFVEVLQNEMAQSSSNVFLLKAVTSIEMSYHHVRV